jgi:pimeloyl-ACP methyl ester carboxylesterase
VPVTYLVNDHDKPTPPELQLEMAGRLALAPTVVHLDSGHVPAVTMPDELAAQIAATVAG